MSDRRMEELRARLGRMASGAEPNVPITVDHGGRRYKVSTGGGLGWAVWALRGFALLFAGVFTLLAPVVTFDCAVSAPGTAACTFSTTTAGVRPLASEHYDGIVRAEATPDGSGIRLLDRNEQVLYERSDSGLAGTSMRSLAQRIQAAIDGTSQAPVRGWQWPLPVAILCTVAVLFVASGLIPVLRWVRRAVFGAPSPEAAARASANGASWVVGLVATAIGAGVCWIAPVVSYTCEPAAGGAHCAVERRYLGIAPIERVDVAGIARASASAYTRSRTERDSSSGRMRTSTESISTVSFQAEDGKALFEDQQSGAIGTSADAIADAVNGLADGSATKPVRVWQMPWLPALFATIALLIGPPTLLVLVLGPLLGASGRAGLAAVVFGGTLLALVAGWVLALLGHMPG